MSRGTAMSIRNSRRFRRRRRAAATISAVTTYPGAPVEAITISTSGRTSDKRSNATGAPWNAAAISSARA